MRRRASIHQDKSGGLGPNRHPDIFRGPGLHICSDHIHDLHGAADSVYINDPDCVVPAHSPDQS